MVETAEMAAMTAVSAMGALTTIDQHCQTKVLCKFEGHRRKFSGVIRWWTHPYQRGGPERRRGVRQKSPVRRPEPQMARGGVETSSSPLSQKVLRTWTAPNPLDGSRCWRRGGEVGAGWCRGARQESPFARRSHRWLRKGSNPLSLPYLESPTNVDDAAAICDAAAGVDVMVALGAWRARCPCA